MLRTTLRRAPALAAAALSLTVAASAQAQTPAPAPNPNETVTTGPAILPVGNDTPTAGVNQCYVRLFKPKDVPETLKSEDSVVVQYRLRCAAEITGFVLSFNREVDGAETELFTTALADNHILGDQAFSCSGEFPGLGVACTGVYKGAYASVRGLVSISLTEAEQAAGTPFCKLGIGATATTFTSVLARDPYTDKVLSNKDGTSQLRHFAAGPVRVTTPACHRGAAASKAKTKKGATAKAAARR